MKTKDIEQTAFQRLLAQKYCKQFHIVDIPSLSYTLAKKSNQNQIKQICGIETVGENANQAKCQREKSKIRQFYLNLKAKLIEILKCVYKCLQSKQLAFSQFFQYQQLVLGGFLRGFVDQTKKQCRQKGDFLEFIWTSTIRLMHSIFQCYEKRYFDNKSAKVQEVFEAHKKYSDFMEKQSIKIKEQSNEIKGLKQIIQIFIDKLRIRRKQVKRLLKQTSHLMSIVNQFKDKNIQLQMKYLTLIEARINSTQLNQKQMKQIGLKKQRLNVVYNQILTIQNSLYKNSKTFEHEAHIQGPLNIEQFIKEAAQMFQNSQISNDQVKAEFQTLFDKVQQDFEDVLFKLKNKNRKRTLKLQFPQLELITKELKQQIKKVEKQCRGTQTTYTDKLNNYAIKNMGIYVNLDGRKIARYKNSSMQYDYQEATQYLKKKNCIQRTIDLRISGLITIQKQKPIRLSLITPQANLFELKNKIINEQEENLQKTQSIISISDRNNKQFGQIAKKKKKKNITQNIKSRFSNVKNSPKKITKIEKIKQNKLQAAQDSSINKKINDKTGKLTNQSNQKKIPIKQNRRSMSAPYEARKRNQSNIKTKNDQKTILNFKNSKFFENDKKQNPMNAHKIIFQQQIPQSTLVPENKKRMHSSISRFSRLSGLNITSFLKKNQQKQTLNTDSKEPNQNYEEQKKFDGNQIKRLINRFEKNEQDQSNLKQGSGIIENLISQTLKTRNKYKNQHRIIAQEHENKQMLQIISDIQGKVSQCGFKSKKILFPIKHNNLMSIIASVYVRAYHKIETQKFLTSFIDPLYQSILILYGSMEKQEIYKKMMNFIAQISYQKKDHICRSFIYFLGMDDEDQSCKLVTSFDNYLYLKLIANLSHSQKPLTDITQATTDVLLLQQKLVEVLQIQGIPQIISCQILSKIKSILQNEVKLNVKKQTKLNLFFCCKIIIKEIIQIKRLIRTSFENFYCLLTKENEKLQYEKIEMMVRCFEKSKVQQLKICNKIQSIQQSKFDSMNLNQFSSCMLRIGIHSFEHYYIKVLTKFDITSMQKRNHLTQNKKVWKNSIYEEEKGKLFKTQQVDDILMLNRVENVTSCLLQDLIGKQIGMLYSVTILMLSQQ